MTYKLLLLGADVDPTWPDRIRTAVPGVDLQTFPDAQAAASDLADADAIYGTLPPDLFDRAERLRWIAAPRAGLGGEWFYPALVESDVVVTNMRGSYNEHLAAHILVFVLAFLRRFDVYLPQTEWRRGPEMLHHPGMTVLMVGVGGAGAEASKLLAALGMHVVAVDPRVERAPDGVARLVRPEALDAELGQADFVVMTAPETPETRGMFYAERFAAMKPGAYFVNIARGRCVVTGDLVAALQSGHLAGAGLDVADPEPLPADNPLWSMPNVLITPHVAVQGAPFRQKWEDILIENCRRFAAGEPLMNVVDKRNWY